MPKFLEKWLSGNGQVTDGVIASLKVSFNDLKDFNNKLNNLNNPYYCNNSNINISVGSNRMENEKSEKQNIQNLDGEIGRSLKLSN